MYKITREDFGLGYKDCYSPKRVKRLGMWMFLGGIVVIYLWILAMNLDFCIGLFLGLFLFFGGMICIGKGLIAWCTGKWD